MRTRLRIQWTAVILAAAGLAFVATPADAQSPQSASEPSKEAWQERYRELLRAVADTQSQVDQTEAAYRQGRRPRKLRGEERLAAGADVAKARQDHADAIAAVEAFPATARRAGVPPGWLREVRGARADAPPARRNDEPDGATDTP